MMENLDWGGISYKRFQQLCIPLSNALYPGRKFKEYLKSGQRQHGIDLKSLEIEGQPQIYIQCKNEKGFHTESKLMEAIEEFIDGIFCTPGVSFTILTSDSQLKVKLQETIEIEKKRLKETYGITFDCWDANDLQEELRNHWRLVDRFFSRNEAAEFCLARLDLDIIDRLEPVPNMMPRALVEGPPSPKEHKPSLHELFWSATTAPKVHLASMLKSNSPTHQYCILGDPYHGKTTYLKHTAHELGTGEAELLPIFIELKNVLVQPIEKILDDAVGSGWREKANDELVIILDAADEVSDDRIAEMATIIRTFTKSYSYTKIVVSCRTRHFKDFKIDETLSHFKILELAQLEYEDIHKYLRSRLKVKAKSFLTQAENSGLHAWLFHPFYLTTLIEEFERSESLPASPLEATKKFLERAYEKASYRKMVGGTFLDEKFAQFKLAINKFAMALQMTGKNAFSSSDLDNFFPSSVEKELLRNNPLITEMKGQWSFSHTFLQEHLAASFLASMDFDEIPSIVWVDKTNKKIKTKWIQTLSSAISMLQDTDTNRQKIINLMEQDSPELIFETEPSSYPGSFKLEALKKLMSYMLANNMWPMRLRPEKIGRFMDGTPGTGRFLIDTFQDKSTQDDKKVYCLRVLQYVSLSIKEKKEVLSITHQYLKKPRNKDVSYELLGILRSHKIGDEADVSLIVSQPENNADHYFRCRVYEWICRLHLTDNFWNYAIDGLPIWVEENRQKSQGGSDYPLGEFLLEITTVEQVTVLFAALSSPTLLKYSKIPGPPSYPFFTALFDRCAEIYSNGGNEPEARILIPISQFVKQSRLHYQHENYPEIDNFIDKTNTRAAVAMLLMDDIMVEERWIPGPIIPEELLDKYLSVFKKKKLKPIALANVGHAIYPADAGNLKRDFAIRANAAAGQEVLPVFDQTENDKMWEAAHKRSANNIQTVQSREAFRNAIRQYFKLRKTPLKNIFDLFETLDYTSPLYIARTPLIEEFIRPIVNSGIRPTLNYCLDQLKSDEDFEHFRVTQLMKEMPNEPYLRRLAEEIIRAYYYRKLPECNFENTYWGTGNGIDWKYTENLVGCIFIQFGFSTDEKYLPELLWLDRLGVRTQERIYGGTESSFIQKIEDQLGSQAKAKQILSKAVIEHLKLGIKLETVLFAHLSLAARLKLESALPFLHSAIYDKKMDSSHTEDLCKFYVLAGGDKEDLLPLLQTSSPDDYYYLHLVRELGPTYYVEVETECLKHLPEPKLGDRTKAYLARELVTLGSLEGLKYLSKYLKINAEVVGMMQLDPQMATLDTRAALEILYDCAEILVDPAYKVSRPPSAQHVLRGWLNALSQKSEADLLLVKEYIEKVKNDLKSKYPDISELNWYAERILENSRTKSTPGMDVRQVKQLLQNLLPTD